MVPSLGALRVGLVAATVLVAHASVDDISTYFGGVNHEPYLTWWTQHGAPRGYTQAAYFAATRPLDTATTSTSTSGAALHWKLDETQIHVAVAVRATGWVGFGLADAGGMKGSDMVYYESASPTQLTDAYAVGNVAPILDECQDWTWVQSHVNNEFLIVEGTRRLDTTDRNDHVILYDADVFMAAQRVIFAWGDTATISYHGPSHTARGGLHWYGDGDDASSFARRMNATANGYFDVIMHNHTLAAVETDYVSICLTWSEYIAQEVVPPNGSVTLVGIEMILDPVSAPYVHHATFNGRRTPPTTNGTSHTCLDGWREYDYPLYGWAPGTYPFIMPDGVGFTLGIDNNGIQGFRIEVHYHNPNLDTGVIDNGGLRLYYSLTPVVHEMGIMYTGDSLQNLRGQAIGNGLSDHRFDCDAGCSQLILFDEPVTVFQEYLHMHAKGVAATQTHYRNGQVLREAKTNYFDFDQSGIHNIRQASYQVQPGDSFQTHCYFSDTTDTVWGKGSTDEMCFGALVYYPAKRIFGQSPWVCTYDIPLSQCNASHSRTLYGLNETHIFRTFGTSVVPEGTVASTMRSQEDGAASTAAAQCGVASGPVVPPPSATTSETKRTSLWMPVVTMVILVVWGTAATL